MQYGLTLNLKYEIASKLSIPELVKTLVELFDSVTCYKVHHNDIRYITVVKAKYSWDEFEGKLALRYRDYDLIKPLMQVEHVCYIGSCFSKAAHYSADNLNGMLLHNEHGEEPHEIYECCLEHISTASHRIMKTAEVINLTPDRPVFWTKVVSWQATKRYYSQKVWQESDGNYEVGYVICSGASPHLGPFNTREDAVNAAKEWDE